MKFKKNNHFKAFCGVFLVVAILLVIQINMVSALEWDNIKDFKDNGKYGTIEVYNSFIIPGVFKGDKLVEYTLKKNTDTCYENCYAEGTATLYTKDNLFDNYRFVDRKGENKNIDYNIYIEIENIVE